MKKKTTPEAPVSGPQALMCPDNHHEAIISMNNSLDIKSWNKAAERIYGIGRSEAINKPLTSVILFAFVGEEPGSFMEELSCHGQWHGQMMYIGKDRIVKFTHVSISAVKDNLGITIGYVAIVREEATKNAFTPGLKPIFDAEYRFVGLVSSDASQAWEMVLHWEE